MEAQNHHALTLRQRVGLFTPVLTFLTVFVSLAAFNFGYDVGTFGGVQGMKAFAQKFGRYEEDAKLGVTLQVTATTAAQFTVGRVINFAMTGFTIVVVPIFQSECAPPALRGMISATLQLQIGFGQLVASLVNYATKGMGSDVSWLVPTWLQLVVPVIILGLLPMLPESPRWLMARGRKGEALKSMMKLRKDAPIELLREEMELLAASDTNQGKGTWKEIFQGYAVIFYQRQKIPNPFGISVIQAVVGLVAISFTSLVVDSFGRRPIFLTGGSFMAFFLFTLGGVGTIHGPNTTQKSIMVASNILFGASYALSWAPLSYTILGEVVTSRLKEKANNLATSISVITTFVVSFTLPYLLNPPHAALGARVGFIYGGVSAISVVVAWLLIPEMKGRSLEEVDEMFEKGIAVRQFRDYHSSGIGGVITGEDNMGTEISCKSSVNVVGG
ncbi:hypothetical protein HOY80DRAFT_1110133 [Tuber brumale]|nr:hypothetical protein HOY80DRAFT_1110133 [Tuber brumale]